MNPVPPARLPSEEMARYGRHLVLPEVGLKGQERLRAASVLVVGAGGLGSPVALYLAAAGVGRIGLVDPDVVDASNLQRQVLYGSGDVGRSKVEVAAERLHDLNPHVTVETHPVRLHRTNAREIVTDYDVVVDGSDNFATRYLVNDACVLEGKPDVFGSILRFEGQASVFGAPDGPCYRCLYAKPPPPGMVPDCAEGGVLGVLPGIIGSIQANEALKLLLGIGDTLAGRLLLFDALAMEFTTVRVAPDPGCAVCGDDPTITELVDYKAFCGVPVPGRAQDGTMVPLADRLSPHALDELLDADPDVVVVDVREEGEVAVCAIPGARNIPLRELERCMGELPRDAVLVMYCKTGDRSARAYQRLRAAGFDQVRDLTGGIMAWRRDLAPDMTPY